MHVRLWVLYTMIQTTFLIAYVSHPVENKGRHVPHSIQLPWSCSSYVCLHMSLCTRCSVSMKCDRILPKLSNVLTTWKIQLPQNHVQELALQMLCSNSQFHWRRSTYFALFCGIEDYKICHLIRKRAHIHTFKVVLRSYLNSKVDSSRIYHVLSLSKMRK